MEGDYLLGRLAVRYKLITMDQLCEGTRYQSHISGALLLGEVLLILGFITNEQLDWLLKVQDAYNKKREAKQQSGGDPVEPMPPHAPGPSLDQQETPVVDPPKDTGRARPRAAITRRGQASCRAGAVKRPPTSERRGGDAQTTVSDNSRSPARALRGSGGREPPPVLESTAGEASTAVSDNSRSPARALRGSGGREPPPAPESTAGEASTAVSDNSRSAARASRRPGGRKPPRGPEPRGGDHSLGLPAAPRSETKTEMPPAEPKRPSRAPPDRESRESAERASRRADPEPARPAESESPRADEAEAPEGPTIPEWSQRGNVGSPDPDVALLVREAAERGASDLHIHTGARAKLRVHGEFVETRRLAAEPEEMERKLLTLVGPRQAACFRRDGELDFSYTLPDVGRLRGNIYKQQRGVDCVLRLIPPEPPSLPDLNLPTGLARFTGYHQGLVLVTGPGGCGKSSTLAALVNIINEERTDHILTIEDPIEYLHVSKRCVVNQRQVRRHTQTFARALRSALREDPDVIVIGELRDFETISLAMSAAETGHLVLGTLHTSSAVRTVDRLTGVFPTSQQSQARSMLAESLRAVISQRLVRARDGRSRLPAIEVMIVTRAIANLIRENKTHQIQSVLQTGSAQGMCLLEHSLNHLVQSQYITEEEARRHVDEATSNDEQGQAEGSSSGDAGRRSGRTALG